MSLFAPVVLFCLVLKDNDFFGFAMVKDLRGNGGIHIGFAEDELVIHADSQDFAEGNSVAGLGLNFFKKDNIALRDAVLLASIFQNSVH